MDKNQQKTHFRKCQKCGVNKPLLDFHLKSNGKNGHDSRCKSCITLLKKNRRKIKKSQFHHITTFDSEIIGKADESNVEEFGRVFGKSIVSLLERDLLQ